MNYERTMKSIESIVNDENVTNFGKVRSLQELFMREMRPAEILVTRLIEDAKRLLEMNDGYFCCGPHESFICQVTNEDEHDDDCPITLHNALMKELGVSE